MSNYDTSNLFFGLENVEMLDGIAKGKITPNGDYDSVYEGGLEAELERLNDEADQYKGMATLIALECVNANRAYAEIAKGVPVEEAFRMYGFEAEDGKKAEEEVSKENIFKRAWKAILGFFSNIIAYLAHLVKIKRISGKVFDVIYNDVDKMKKRITDNEGKASDKTDAKVALTKGLEANWDKVAEVYTPGRATVDGKEVELGDTEKIDPEKIRNFVDAYAEKFNIKQTAGKLTEEQIETSFKKYEEDLTLKGADEKDGEVTLASAIKTVKERLNKISEYAKERKGYNRGEEAGSAARGDAIRHFEKAFDGCKKMHKAIDKAIADNKLPEDSSKETMEVLSNSLKAMAKLCAKQAKVYNFCLRDFTTLTGYAVKDGAAVASKLK